MSEVKKSKNPLMNDVFWYALGTMIPMGINVVKTPIFTRHYTAEDYGYFGLVMGIFLYLSTVCYSWLASCIWRYYNTFEQKNILHKFYSNLLFLYVVSSGIILLSSLLFITFYHEPFIVFKLIILCFLHFILKELIGLFYVILRVKGYAKSNNILSILQVALSFILLIVCAFIFDFDITALISSSIIIDVFFVAGIVFYLIKTNKLKSISIDFVNSKYLKIYLNYGSFILLSSIVTLLIVSSDRYILALYDSIENVGIYTKVYDIAQISITAFVFVFFNVINPKMNKVLTANVNTADTYIQKYLFAYIFCLLPITFLISLYSKEISTLLLGEEFRTGHTIMPYVFFSAFIYGIVTFNQNKLKFKNKLKTIVFILTFCFIVNLILNFIVVPKLGYKGTAVTTLITYVLMLILFFRKESFGFLKIKAFTQPIIQQIIVLIVLYAIDLGVRKIVDFNITTAIIEGVIFLSILLILFRNRIKKIDLPV